MKQIYLIGNAHLDPVWLWKKPEGLSEILSTFRSALDRMKEFPDYIFTSACASYYEWVEKIDPDMFREIQERVAEGRWDIAGGFWVQPDCNIPSGEAFVRHMLYSQRYFREKFGVTATVGYHVDSFGHNGMLPQLLKKGGMDSYIFQRPDDWENSRLNNHFRWQSPDGSEVTVHRLVRQYNDWGDMPDGSDPIKAKLTELQGRAMEEALPYMDFYGVGNHGGGPTIRCLQVLDKAVKESDQVVYSGLQQYFDDLDQAGKTENLPLWTGDLQHHASGCYAANAVVKAANRRAENSLIKAEKYDLLAQRLLGSPSHQSEITAAWKKLMFNQFHDILAGCSIRDAYVDALDAFSAVNDTATEITNEALHRISWNVRTTRGLNHSPCQKNGWILWEKDGEGAPIVVFNPHSFPVDEVVQINTTAAGVVDQNGQPVPCQNVRGPQTNGDDRVNTIFTAHLPAMGYAVYYIYRDHAFDLPADGFVKAEGSVLENELIRITFDAYTGSIVSFYDKENETELSAAPMAQAVVIDDHEADTWAHRLFVFDKEIGRFTDAAVCVLENGPVRAAVRVTTKYQNSVLRQDFRLVPGAKEVTVHCLLDFHEHLKSVKLSFPVRAEDAVAAYSMPYGFLTKETDGAEEPSHQWMSIGARSGKAGLALCNNSKYSFCAKPCEGGADMRMIIARGSIYADHFGIRDDLVEYMDQGEQFFDYSLLPTKGEPAEVVRRAAVLNTPPELLMETHHEGRLAPSYEGIRISRDNVALTAAKNAEDGNGLILRLVETSGLETDAEVDAAFLGLTIPVHLKPQEIVTLRVEPDTGKVGTVFLTEW